MLACVNYLLQKERVDVSYFLQPVEERVTIMLRLYYSIRKLRMRGCVAAVITVVAVIIVVLYNEYQNVR